MEICLKTNAVFIWKFLKSNLQSQKNKKQKDGAWLWDHPHTVKGEHSIYKVTHPTAMTQNSWLIMLWKKWKIYSKVLKII